MKKFIISAVIVVIHIIAYIIVGINLDTEEAYKILLPSVSSLISLIIAVQVANLNKNKSDVKISLIPSSNGWNIDLRVLINNISESIILVDSISAEQFRSKSIGIEIMQLKYNELELTVTPQNDIHNNFWGLIKYIFPKRISFIIFYTSLLDNKQKSKTIKIINPFCNRREIIRAIISNIKNKLNEFISKKKTS